MGSKEFQQTIWEYYRKAGRNLPWRRTKDPYRILVSEVMLQQTQVSRVIQKYEEFLKRFPDVKSAAKAPLHEVLAQWQGLGYNRRAFMLKHACEEIVQKYDGGFPKERDKLEALPGIGPATAGAVLAFAFGLPTPFLETNIRRVYLHFFFPKRKNVHDKEILRLVEETMDRDHPREWYWALMDYGAMLGKTLRQAEGKQENPNKRSVHYGMQSRFEGSLRQARGEAIRMLLDGPKKKEVFQQKLGARAEKALAALLKEGFVEEKKGEFALAR